MSLLLAISVWGRQKKHNKRWEWFHIYLAKLTTLKNKNNPARLVFPLGFSTPQNYNVQIHKGYGLFLHAGNKHDGQEKMLCSIAAAFYFFASRSWFDCTLLSVCLSASLNHTLPNHATDY